MHDAEIIVIGSGPGGAISAALLAEAGRDVLLVEEGPALALDSCAPFSQAEMVQKYRNAGATVALGEPKLAYVEGRCVGGGSEVNSALYHRTPAPALEAWRQDYEVRELDALDADFAAIESYLGVGYLPHPAPASSTRLRQGADSLGWQAIEVPRWYRYADGHPPRRQSMSETFVRRALKAGTRLLAGWRASALRREAEGWQVLAQSKDAERSLRGRAVFVCAGAVHTAALLRRCGVGLAGAALRMHPSIKVTALFDDPVNEADAGVGVHQVKEFAPAATFGCSISSPPHLHLALMDQPGGTARVAADWRRMATYYAMVTEGCGSVRPLPGLRDPLVRFTLGAAGFARLVDALGKLCECLFAAGARVLFPSVAGGRALRSMQEVRSLAEALRPADLQLMSVHLMGTCPLGERRSRCVADSFGRVHGHAGLYINDASMIPTALGANPQGSVMALAMRNAAAFLRS